MSQGSDTPPGQPLDPLKAAAARIQRLMSDQALPGRRAAPPVETLPPRQRLRELLGSLYEHHAKAESFRRDRIAAALEHIQRIATSALEVGVDERARNGEVELEMDLEALHRFLLNPDLDTLGDAQRKRA